MKADQFFTHAIHATADYDAALILTLLATQGAVESPVRSTLTRLTSDMSGAMTRSQAWRATNRLCANGLLRAKVYPRTWTEYHVDQAAAAELLRRAAQKMRQLGGLVSQPVSLPTDVAVALAASQVELRSSAAPMSAMEVKDNPVS